METNIENLQYLLSKMVEVNTGYLDAITTRDIMILRLNSEADGLRRRIEELEFASELPVGIEVSQ